MDVGTCSKRSITMAILGMLVNKCCKQIGIIVLSLGSTGMIFAVLEYIVILYYSFDLGFPSSLPCP